MGSYQVDVKPRVPPDSGVPFSGHWKAAEHFVKVVRGEQELIVKKEEVLNVMRALEGIYRSAAEGCEIRLEQL